MIISAIYANADNTAAVIEIKGRGPVLISMNDTPGLWGELSASGVHVLQYTESPPVHAVPKLLVVERLEAAGLRQAAKEALSRDDFQQDRWNAAIEIRSDDVGVRALLAAIGGDPDQILAAPSVQ